MRKFFLALSLLSATPALADMPQDVMELMSRMRVIYIRGEHILMTVTGIKLDTKSGAFSATAQWQPPEYKGIPYTCELPVEGQLTGFVLQFANNRCSGRFTYMSGTFSGEAQITGVGIFPAKFSIK
jgi:hypothetical protein